MNMYFYEVRAESNDMNFIMMHEDNGEAIYVDFYFGNHSTREFANRVYEYCSKNMIGASSDIDNAYTAFASIDIIEDSISDFLDGFKDEPKIKITINDEREWEFSINAPEVAECVVEFLDSIANVYYELETM